jgi:His-Xaa-Ser system protein HxsD
MSMTRGDAEIMCADRSIRIDAACFDCDVIYRACYLLTDRAWLWLEPDSSGIVVHLTAKPDEDTAILAHELGNLLLDQAVRKVIARETEDVRRLILDRALAGAAP